MNPRVKSILCDAVAVCGLTLLALVSGCGGGGSSTPAVTLTLKSIAVTGGSSVNVGATDPFTATGTFSDGTTRNLTASVTWSSSSPANATISNAAGSQGVATGVLSGTTMITAKDNATGITSPAVTLTVVAVPALSSIAISPMPTVSIPLGGTQNFSASASFSDGSIQANFTTSCAWTSSNTAAVTIGANTGVAMAANNAAVGATSNISCSAAIPAGTPTVTSNTVVATITTTTTTLAITTTALPNATVGAAYDQPILTSGGDGTAITFALASGFSLPSWAGLDSSTGHITNTRTIVSSDVGTSPAFQISATQSGITVTSGNLTLTVLANINAELNGTYAFLLRGFVGSHAITIGGSFIADGAGNITGGVMDINDASPSPQTGLTITPAPMSVYSVGTDNRGQLTLTTSGGAQKFDFSLGSITAGVASLGHIISRQASLSSVGSAISGVFKKQDTSAFTLTALNGDWAFLGEGADSTGGRFAEAGRVTFSTGTLSNGVLDINDAGNFDGGTVNPFSFSGSLGAIETTTGRVPLTIQVGPSTTSHSAVYIVSGSELLFATTDAISTTNALLAGSVLRQSTTFCPTTGACTFSNNALNGNAVVYIQSNSGPGTVASCSVAGVSTVQVGALTFTPATTSFSGGFDTNACGTIATPSTATASGNYSVASNGRVTVSNSGSNPPFLYMVNTNHAFLIGTNSGRVESGVCEPQAASPFTVVSGGRAFGAESPAVKGSLVYSGVETLTAGTPNSITAIQDQNRIQGGLREGVHLLTDTFTIDATGRITFASGLKVGYFINSTRSVVIDVQSTDNTPTISISDNQ